MKICDLHTHSTFSDGSCSPQRLLLSAKESGLSAIALTDHNTVDGLETFLVESKKLNVEGIAGIEISSEYNGVELHVIGLFIERQHFQSVKAFLEISKRRKEESNKALALRLQENGYAVTYEEAQAQTLGIVNRVHFANVLIKKGYLTSVEEGFKTILSAKNGFYVPPKRLTTLEVIEFLQSINAVSVLAHPLLNLSRVELVAFLKEAKNVGLTAIETMYSKYSIEDQAFSMKIAEEFGLLQSGGSDFHGDNKPNVKLGALQVPYHFLEALKASRANR